MDPVNDQARKERMAKILIDIGAVGARPDEPFTFTSGTRILYIDERRLISYVARGKRL
jgi:hypothetical protein